VHRFINDWEPAASLALRHGDTAVFDTYEAHDRIAAGSFDTHLDRLARDWLDHHRHGRTVAITATTNEHVDAINRAIHDARVNAGELPARPSTVVAGGDQASVGDIIVTRRNDRSIITSTGDSVRNRDRWTITVDHGDGSLTVTPLDGHGHGHVRLPVDYVREHVRLGYAATEHGNQGVTTDIAYQLVTDVTTHRGLYVGATRGRDSNQFLVVTDTNDIADARDVLDRVLTFDRADVPATAQRRHLHAVQPPAPDPEPIPMWVPEPAWLGNWRDALVSQRMDILERRHEHDQLRQESADALDALEPAVIAARLEWQPYRRYRTSFRYATNNWMAVSC